MYAQIYAQIHHIILRIWQLKQRSDRLEAEWDTIEQILELKKQIFMMKIELEKLKSFPAQIIIQKLENKVDSIDVSKLEGILNIGVSQNHSGERKSQDLFLGGKSLEEILSGMKQGPAAEKEQQAKPDNE